MQNDQIYSEIINSITTKDDIGFLNSELDLLGRSIYEVKENFDSVLKSSFRANIYSLISKLLQTEKKEDVIKKIKSKLDEIEIIELTLSTEPKEKTLETVSSWLAKSIPQKVAIDIKINQQIMGGAIIVFKGKYFDASLKNSLENVLKNYV